ncbi:long-chain-fatty-acid--CoA ligase [Fictibacillus macauensis ZFHKF-1]|uniref:Long-chain-fatty-acid--CoA ligase n=1 Tax=Fictibacillus macauensis ZFHKF-1 TaxID=1196324 RepID=I8UIR1_9BACL|nr:class I adenylate-forming enzyme family protein [Fictibacillus macauensis]EIT86723.1 long-chain-fatty-acid--CoA ligase [Fictibacillus macauensis ZFHKF-1]
MMATLHGWLERNARKYVNKEALVTDHVRVSYEEWNQTCNQLAHLLLTYGVSYGDHVGIIADTNEHFVYAYFSLLKIGAVAVPISCHLTTEETISLLDQFDVRFLLCEDRVYTSLQRSSVTLPATFYSIEDLLLRAHVFSDENLELTISNQTTCAIMVTEDKSECLNGVVVTHEQVMAVATSFAYEFQVTSADSVLSTMPLSHSTSLHCFFLAGLYAGSSHHLHPFSPARFVQVIQEEQPTITYADLRCYSEMAHHYDADALPDRFPSINIFAYGGGRMTTSTYEKIRRLFPVERLYHVYGVTEMGANGTILRPYEHAEKMGSIGREAVISMEMTVVNDEGKETRAHEYGELMLRGDSMSTYYKEIFPFSFEKPWFATGEIGYRDEDDYVFIVDRKKNVITLNGMDVYPREIEEVLAAHPHIVAASVVSISHNEKDNKLKAVLVTKEGITVTQQAMQTYVSTYLAPHQQPSIFRFVAALPRNENGEVLKAFVKEL